MSAKKDAPDAMATLGTILEGEAGRDAIHVAVMSAVAAHTLLPGYDVGLLPDGTACVRSQLVGIVDPFLKTPVHKGQRFWLFIYPRQITSLRHVWSHPTIADEATDVSAPVADDAADPVAMSRKWIESFALDLGQDYASLMHAATKWVELKDYTWDNSEAYKGYWDQFPEFWNHYETVTGKKLTIDRETCFFTCSC